MSDPYEEPKLDMSSLERAINSTLDQHEKHGVDLKKIRDEKVAELQKLMDDNPRPTTDVQRLMIVKRVFIRLINKRWVFMD